MNQARDESTPETITLREILLLTQYTTFRFSQAAERRQKTQRSSVHRLIVLCRCSAALRCVMSQTG